MEVKIIPTGGQERIHMASSMSLLGFKDGTDGSSSKGYLDIVEFIVNNCADVEENLEELYRRFLSVS